MIDLDAGDLALVRTILAKHVPGCEVRVFGSRYHRTARKYSDLDLALVSAHKLDWRTKEALKEEFAESDLPISVDIVDFNAISASFRQIITEGCEIIQEK